MLIATDEPRPFTLTSATSVPEAVQLWQENRGEAMYLAGGGDAIDMLKKHHATPSLVIDLKRIPDLSTIEASEGGLTIGGLTTLDDIANNELVQRYLPALAKAAGIVATPQIRNVGTIGGNLLQENRCPYYRGPWHCYRHGGLHCYAHHGFHREHAIFDGDRCYVVTPSDLAPVIVAANARIHVHGPEGERIVVAENLFVSASDNLTRMHSLSHGEVLTAVEFRAPDASGASSSKGINGSRGAGVPTPPPDKIYRSTFIKNALRNSFDFPLVNVAVFMKRNGRRIEDARIVLGAVAATPHRCQAAEKVLIGETISAQLFQRAADAAVADAEPLPQNTYKVAIARKLVNEALAELGEMHE